MCSKTRLVRATLLFAAVLFQFGFLDLRKYAVRAEEETDDSEKAPETDIDEKEDTEHEEVTTEHEVDEVTGKTVAKGDCPRPYYREYCTDEKPCCLYNMGSHVCQSLKEEGENCTQNAFAYNTRDCFCKQGLFCVDGKCTSDTPKQTEEEF